MKVEVKALLMMKLESFIARPFTFPVSAMTNKNWRYDREFTFQASALEFLSSQ